jgi:type 1 fimbriae regulatory protein FimB
MGSYPPAVLGQPYRARDRASASCARSWFWRASESDGSSRIALGERGPLTRDGFSKLLRAVASRAGIKNAHPHDLRHGCGHALAMKGRDRRLVQEYLGHTNVRNTARYMDSVSARFRGIWD